MIEYGSEEEKLLEAIGNENIEKVKTILNNSTENKKILKLNEKNRDGNYPLLEAISKNNIEMVLLLIKYANQHQIILELNEKNKVGDYPLLEAISKNNIEIVQLLIEYVNQHQIILELNEKNIYGNYPLYWAIYENNIEIVKLLIEYANQHQIILELNEKDKYGLYPLYSAIYENNIEIVQLLLEYALQHQIILEYDKWKIGNNPKIKNLLQNYEKEMENRKKNGANGFRNYNGNISVNSLNKSNYISNPPPYTSLPTHTPTPPPPYSPPPTPPTTQVPSSNPLNYVDENRNEKGDLAVVLFKHVGNTSDELTINKGEYLIVTNWNVGDGYAYGYKRNDPQQKGKFPSPLVCKISENNVEVKNLNQTPLHQTDRSSVVSDISSLFSISSSPSISQSFQRPTAPLDNRFSYLSDNRLSILSENSSQISISSSPSITSSTQQQPPTAPSETLLKHNNRKLNVISKLDKFNKKTEIDYTDDYILEELNTLERKIQQQKLIYIKSKLKNNQQEENVHQQSINSDQLYPTSLMNHVSSPLKTVILNTPNNPTTSPLKTEILNIPHSPTPSSPTLKNVNSSPSTTTDNSKGSTSDAVVDNPKSPESEATLAQESSSNHEEEIETKIATHVCNAWYSPNLDDELRMTPGDELIILEKFNDGWALGQNTEGNVGVFPLDCVTLIDYDRSNNSFEND